MCNINLEFPEELADKYDNVSLGSKARIEEHLNGKRKPGSSQACHYCEPHGAKVLCFVALRQRGAEL